MICIQKRIQEEGLMSRMIIQVHDELNFKCHKSEQYLLKSLVTNCSGACNKTLCASNG